MKQTQKELLKLHTTSDDQSTTNPQSNSELVTREFVTDTPFHIVGNDETGYFVAIGQFRLCKPKPTKQECRELIHNKDWDLLISMMIAVVTVEKIQPTEHQTQYYTENIKTQHSAS